MAANAVGAVTAAAKTAKTAASSTRENGKRFRGRAVGVADSAVAERRTCSLIVRREYVEIVKRIFGPTSEDRIFQEGPHNRLHLRTVDLSVDPGQMTERGQGSPPDAVILVMEQSHALILKPKQIRIRQHQPNDRLRDPISTSGR